MTGLQVFYLHIIQANCCRHYEKESMECHGSIPKRRTAIGFSRIMLDRRKEIYCDSFSSIS